MLAPNPSQHLESETEPLVNPSLRFSLPESCSSPIGWSRSIDGQDRSLFQYCGRSLLCAAVTAAED
jgi:hypothetical protein